MIFNLKGMIKCEVYGKIHYVSHFINDNELLIKARKQDPL